jgi:hypothetical protein
MHGSNITMTRDGSNTFLTKPPLWHMAMLLGVGFVLVLWAYIYGRSCRPQELPYDIAKIGILKVNETLQLVGKSDFGRSHRGATITAVAMELLDQGRIKFSPDLIPEALYRKDPFCRPVLYISVFSHKGRVLWPRPEELAERVFHESLHSVVHSKHRSKEEECDAFCAAEEAVAAVGHRSPRYPVMRDGITIWEWVQEVYSQYPSDKTYAPVGCTSKELTARTGIAY